LRHIYPQADIPVVQLSIDETQTPSFHHQIGERLALLREEGVLILGSGNIVHNLHAYAWGRHAPEPFDWAISFETRVRQLLLAGDYKPLVNYEHQLGSEAELAVPTPDHYLPLLYVAGTRISSEPVAFPVEGRRWRVNFDACSESGLISGSAELAKTRARCVRNTLKTLAPGYFRLTGSHRNVISVFGLPTLRGL
jgi:aromatic ring-opening dioxygenase catalytic subunit (LigB family)